MGRGLRVREIDLFKIRQQCGSNFGVRSGFFYPRAQNSLYTSVLRAIYLAYDWDCLDALAGWP